MPPYYEGYGESEAQKNIVEYGIYGFDEPERWTKEMIEFTELCLTYEQDKRPTAAELWKVRTVFAGLTPRSIHFWRMHAPRRSGEPLSRRLSPMRK